MNYGAILKKLRIKNNLTQEDMANILNIARITYNHYETQEKIIPLERLLDICNYFKVSIDYIFNLTSNNYNQVSNLIDKNLVGLRIKNFRKENKITQESLAKFLNTNRSVIANYECGRYLINTPFLYMICKKYNISADYLLGRVDNPKYL